MSKRCTLFLGLAVLAIIVTACVRPDPIPDPTDDLRPPPWIQGSWGAEGVPEVVYTFTPTSFIMKIGNVSLDYGELLRQTASPVTQIRTDALYSFTMPDEQGGFQTFEFVRLDENTISYTLRSNVGQISAIPLVRLQP